MSYLFEAESIIHPKLLKKRYSISKWKLGDWQILYSSLGFFIIFYVIAPESGIPEYLMLFDNNGNIISDTDSIDGLIDKCEELKAFKVLKDTKRFKKIEFSQKDVNPIVKVRGSSSCFEYQFPASPEFFIGRESLTESFDNFIDNILTRNISSRGILFEANSGWGKSSIVLRCLDKLIRNGHYAFAIDSRSVSSSKFILYVMDFVLNKLDISKNKVNSNAKLNHIGGFQDLMNVLKILAKYLEREKKLLVIFLDQFESLFYQREALKQIRNLFFKIQEIQSNIIIGFSWKTDMVGLTNEFPYEIRDALKNLSIVYYLNPFDKNETETLIDQLSKELKSGIRNDLKFFLSEYSQGLPWLLKKLCAHVKSQVEEGIPQSEIAYSLLNIEQLFQNDLKGLNAEEEDTLKRIAHLERISINELGDLFNTKIIQSLVNRRLLVRIGSKYSIYWDIFRDYLISGFIPYQENYILRTHIRTILTAMRILVKSGSDLTTEEFQEFIDVKKHTFYNILRDLRILGLVKVESELVQLNINVASESPQFEEKIQKYLQEKFKRNRIMNYILEDLEKNEFTIKKLAKLMEDICPYISAVPKTWKTYAKIMIKWINYAGLAYFDKNDSKLKKGNMGTKEIRFPLSFYTKKPPEKRMPSITYGPIEKLAIRLVDAFQNEQGINLADFSKSSISKALTALEALGFIKRKGRTIILLSKIFKFVYQPQLRSKIFRNAAIKNESFKKFLEIFEQKNSYNKNLMDMGKMLAKKLNKNWRPITAKSYAKILLNWIKNSDDSKGFQTTLFDSWS